MSGIDLSVLIRKANKPISWNLSYNNHYVPRRAKEVINWAASHKMITGCVRRNRNKAAVIRNADVCCAGGRGGKGVQRGRLCKGAFRATLRRGRPRVGPKDKPHIAWHPTGDPDQGGKKPCPHSGKGQGPETDYWAYLICTVRTHTSLKIHRYTRHRD